MWIDGTCARLSAVPVVQANGLYNRNFLFKPADFADRSNLR